MNDREGRDVGMLSLELLLYAEEHYGYLSPTTMVVAFARALAHVVARSVKPDADVERDVVLPMAAYLRTALADLRAQPAPFSPREILDAYRAEREGRPWKH